MKNKIQIIDWEGKGNVIRFYLGEDGGQWGDDWDKKPYEHNAGRVYDEYIKGHKDIIIPFEQFVFEPCTGHLNSPYSKEDMIQRGVPCVVIAPQNTIYYSFERALADANSKRYYFGDML